MIELIKKGLYGIYWIIMIVGIGFVPLMVALSFAVAIAEHLPDMTKDIVIQILILTTFLASWPWLFFWIQKGPDLVLGAFIEFKEEILEDKP